MAYDATFGNSDYFKLSDYRFLLANLPLADLTCLEAEDLIENVNLARNALDRMPWGASIPPDLYDHFILPHRVSQEPFVKWRRLFLDELAPRVEGLSMPEAILEVNHWCHEKATYRPTDGRDQDPLTTIRSGYGRCEEEMILTICALRAVAIPARQCYTPYWAHSDDNHAWVEAWADGQWYYLGACEPAQSLNSAWFSSPAQRAILIISTAYGDYTGDEPVLRRYGRSTAINSTSVYGPVKQLQVVLLDRKGRTLPGAKAVFSLWNYGTLMPATALTSDANGHLTLISGIGDWFVAVQVNERMAFAHVEGSTESLTLRLTAKEPDDWSGGFYYKPPPAASAPAADIISAEGEARGIISPEVRERADSLFRTRLTREDSLRETCLWPLRPNFGDDPGSVYLKPDSARFWSDPAFASVDDTLRDVLLQRLLDARGNWLAIYDFLNGKGREGADPAPTFDPLRWEVVKRLTPKDLLDWPGEPYEVTTTLDLASDDGHLKSHLASLDSAARERFLDFVLPVRIDDEPASGRRERSQLASFLRKELPAMGPDSKGNRVRHWIARNITIERDPDRLGPPLLPSQVLALRRGTRRDIERLYIALCRQRGMPARRNPVSGEVEKWEVGSGWKSVPIARDERPGDSEMGKGKLQLEITSGDSLSGAALYLRDWALSRWKGDRGEPVDLGWHRPAREIITPVDLPVGWYLLTSGMRLKDGSVNATLRWFEVQTGRTTRQHLRLSPTGEANAGTTSGGAGE